VIRAKALAVEVWTFQRNFQGMRGFWMHHELITGSTIIHSRLRWNHGGNHGDQNISGSIVESTADHSASNVFRLAVPEVPRQGISNGQAHRSPYQA
jgi:hypothetical protein